jgi:hypothetical protein
MACFAAGSRREPLEEDDKLDSMRRNWKYKALIAVAVAALIAGGLTAIFRSGHHHNHPARAHAAAAHGHRSGNLAVAADYLGVTRTQLRHELQVHHTLGQVAEATNGRSATALVAALVSAKTKKLQAAVASGKLTPIQEQASAARLHARAATVVARAHAGATANSTVAIAAGYLGVSSKQLRSERQAGRSLAEIANARAGKSATGLIDAIVERKAKLTAGAAGSHRSPARKQMLLSQLRRRVTAEVNRAPSKRPTP